MASRPLPDRYHRSCVLQQTLCATGSPLRACLPDGLQYAFFFLRGPARRIGLDRPQAADLLVEDDQFGTQVLHMMELGDFALGFAEGRWTGKGLSYGLAVYFAD